MTIVERLRALVILDEMSSDNPLGREAADEIDQLRAKLEYAVTGYKEAADVIERLNADNGRLRAENEQLKIALSDRPRDDGTVVAVGGEPGASAGKSE